MPEVENNDNQVEETIETAQQNQPAGGSGEQSKKERLWTSDEVDAYVKARIDKQRLRHSESDAEKDSRIAELEEQAKSAQATADQLQQEKQLAQWAQEVSKETGIPASVLRGASREELMEHAEQIKASVPIYPSTGDKGAQAQKQVTKEDIKNMTNDREMLAALKTSLGQNN